MNNNKELEQDFKELLDIAENFCCMNYKIKNSLLDKGFTGTNRRFEVLYELVFKLRDKYIGKLNN